MDIKFILLTIIFYLLIDFTEESYSRDSEKNRFFRFIQETDKDLIERQLNFKEKQQLEKCGEICKEFYSCDEKIGKCIHKGFFPLYPIELIQTLVFILSSAIATACGVGGGFIYSSFLMYIEDFLPIQAFPIASILILICSASTYYSGIKHKLEHPDSDFVNLDFVIIYTPMMLLGTKFGTIFNKVFSSFILFLILIFILVTSFQKTYKSALENHKKEQFIEKQGYQELEDLKTASNNDLDLNKNTKRAFKNSPKSDLMESKIEIKRKTSKNSRESNHKEEIEQEIKVNSSLIHHDLSREENNPLRLDRLKYIIYFEIISIVDQIIEGNSKIPSLIGIKRCSGTYWLVFIIHIGFTVYCTNEMFKVLKISFDFKKCVLTSFKDPQFEYIEANKMRVAFMGLIAGLVGGMIGVGGGMISNPLLLTMGFNPKITTSTSNFLILLSSFTATVIFIFAGQIDYEFAIFLGIPCGISAFYGSNYIQDYIKRTKRSAFLLFLLSGLQIASGILLLFSNLRKTTNDIIKGNSLFGITSFC